MSSRLCFIHITIFDSILQNNRQKSLSTMSCHSYRSYHQFVINVMYTNFKNYLLLQVVILNIPIGGKTKYFHSCWEHWDKYNNFQSHTYTSGGRLLTTREKTTHGSFNESHNAITDWEELHLQILKLWEKVIAVLYLTCTWLWMNS